MRDSTFGGLASKIIVYLAALCLVSQPAWAASVPLLTGPTGSNPAVFPADLPDINATINSVNSLVTPTSMAPFGTFRNYLDNGAMTVAQRGTSAQTGGTTSGCVVSAYVADRFCVDTNVTSGAGFGQVITSTPSPPTGFTNSVKVYRNSGALTQPVCYVQEVLTKDSVQLAGQQVVLSFYAQALAGLSADNGNVINAYIIYGTGTDQGLGTMTASPAITPAWSGINASQTAAYTLSSSAWNRYTLSGTIPTTATEVGVEVCFTPTATGSGTTDGFAITGAQLEVGTAASSFEFRPYGIELAKAQQYYWQITDGANTVMYPSGCNVTTANTTVKCAYTLPQVMRSVPTTTVSTATSFGILLTAGTAGTCTTLAATASSNTTQAIGLTCTTGGTIALGTGTTLIGAGTAGTLSASADF